MSDREGHSGGGAPTDDDLSLPKATVAKMIAEFIHLISSEANEICEQENKKTIAPEHIITALTRLGFTTFAPEVESVLKDHKQQQKDREKKVSKFEKSGMTEEELAAAQEELFAQSRARYNNGQQ
ncbi:Negative cofactor 2 complex subunit beta [Psilocybe cubensis]|uniref:Negative cofactor 2 complex subunit beta n=1 Tax=Psilocybe cubensis TaxID=181762 RepID=A0ACB8H553_PSICU|nr:Negative cofactor 2 complex subunit beta [Psilocybe cubensis]KAH9482621.1 Negative cofactor 2 complex subunit beta [Psilocybe cubensis]